MFSNLKTEIPQFMILLFRFRLWSQKQIVYLTEILGLLGWKQNYNQCQNIMGILKSVSKISPLPLYNVANQ